MREPKSREFSVSWFVFGVTLLTCLSACDLPGQTNVQAERSDPVDISLIGDREIADPGNNTDWACLWKNTLGVAL